MNKPLNDLVIEWIGGDNNVHERDWEQANLDEGYNLAKSVLRERVPELVEKLKELEEKAFKYDQLCK